MKLLMLMLCMSALAAGAAAATDAAQLKRLQDEARKQQEQWINRIKELPGTFKMSDICLVTQEQGRLTLKSELNKLEQGQARVKIEGVSGVTIVMAARDRGNEGNLIHFSLRNVNFSDAEAVQIDTNISWTRGHFSVSRSIRMPDGAYQGISLSQNDRVTGEDGRIYASVQFSVNAGSVTGQPVSFFVQAEDFRAIRQQRPAEIEKYLRPLLRELRLEAVMAVDPIIAWQVFADEWKPDPKLAADMPKIIEQLDADDFAAREAAMKQLQATGKPGALVIHHTDRTKLSAQQNMLLDTFLGPMMLMSQKEAAKLRRDRDFMLDCLYSDDLAVRKSAMGRLQAIAGCELDFDAAADAAARTEAVERLRHQLTSGATTRPGPSTRPGRATRRATTQP